MLNSPRSTKHIPRNNVSHIQVYSMKNTFHKLYYEYYNERSLSKTLQHDIEYRKIQCSNTYKIQETNVDSTNNVCISFFINNLITRM